MNFSRISVSRQMSPVTDRRIGPWQSAAVQKRHWQLIRKISLQMWHGSANTTFTLDFQIRDYHSSQPKRCRSVIYISTRGYINVYNTLQAVFSTPLQILWIWLLCKMSSMLVTHKLILPRPNAKQFLFYISRYIIINYNSR